MSKSDRIDPLVHYSRRVRALEAELAAVRSELQRWAEWGAHVYTCPNSARNGQQQECWDCVSPSNQDQIIERNAGIS
jgi:hypothetical protein